MVSGKIGAAAKEPGVRIHRLVVLGLVLSAVGITAAIVAGPGNRFEWWNFRAGFRILNWAAYFGFLGLVLSVWGAILTRPGRGHGGFPLALAGVVLGAVAFGVPANWFRIARQVPMIHDISTDTENPPAFVAILPLRKNAPNSAVYGGPEIAGKQHAAYPDIRPFEAAVPPPQAFDYALGVARRMGWQIVDANRQEGRIEATATTRWFGFKDDIVIRIVPNANNGSRLDIRSVSRVGLSDVGTNARRIRAFLKNFSGYRSLGRLQPRNIAAERSDSVVRKAAADTAEGENPAQDNRT